MWNESVERDYDPCTSTPYTVKELKTLIEPVKNEKISFNTDPVSASSDIRDSIAARPPRPTNDIVYAIALSDNSLQQT